jgi:hypothetical protein
MSGENGLEIVIRVPNIEGLTDDELGDVAHMRDGR